MHAYAWYVWRQTPRTGPSLKVRIGKAEAKRTIDFASGRGASRRQRGPNSGNVNKFAVKSVRWAVTEFRYERSRSADPARRQVL